MFIHISIVSSIFYLYFTPSAHFLGPRLELGQMSKLLLLPDPVHHTLRFHLRGRHLGYRKREGPDRKLF